MEERWIISQVRSCTVWSTCVEANNKLLFYLKSLFSCVRKIFMSLQCADLQGRVGFPRCSWCVAEGGGLHGLEPTVPLYIRFCTKKRVRINLVTLTGCIWSDLQGMELLGAELFVDSPEIHQLWERIIRLVLRYCIEAAGYQECKLHFRDIRTVLQRVCAQESSP